MKKRCCTCGDVLDIDEFYRNRSMPDGHSYRCKFCDKVASKVRGTGPLPRYIRVQSQRKKPQPDFTSGLEWYLGRIDPNYYSDLRRVYPQSSLRGGMTVVAGGRKRLA